jgi:hypothetical protein
MEKDQSAWLPEPPPPRPARRDAAIEAALRKFDGGEDAAPSVREAPRRSWASTHRPQLALALSAMLLVVIGVPAALIGIRNESAPPVTPERAVVVQDVEQAPAPRAAEPPPAPPPAPAPEQPPALRKYRGVDREDVLNSLPRAEVAPPVAAVAASPPPPPPPPAPAPRAERSADEGAAQEMMVTGSRIAQPALEAPSAAKAMSVEQPYAAFLSRLQAAVRRNDRDALIALVSFPLRVNFAGGARTYRDAASLGRDFDRVFTPKVKRAVLAQRPDRLFVRDLGAMVGDGELWFRETCPNASCSPPGPLRIVAVNP